MPAVVRLPSPAAQNEIASSDEHDGPTYHHFIQQRHAPHNLTLADECTALPSPCKRDQVLVTKTFSDIGRLEKRRVRLLCLSRMAGTVAHRNREVAFFDATSRHLLGTVREFLSDSDRRNDIEREGPGVEDLSGKPAEARRGIWCPQVAKFQPALVVLQKADCTVAST